MGWNPFDPTGALGGGGLDIFGTGAAKDANKANEKRYGQALGLWNTLYGPQAQAYGQGERYLTSALGKISGGFSQGRSLLAGAGQTAKTNILQQGKQQLGGLNQNLTSRGLENTTVLDNAQRGIHADTSRALASVDANIANMMASLGIAQGQAEAGALGNLAQLQQNKFGSLQGIVEGKSNVISSRQDVAAPSLLSQLAPLAMIPFLK